MLGATKGGAVRLASHSNRLIVAEGIETALSLASGLYKKPAAIWAALSASNMASLRLPDTVGTLVVAPDGDEVGRKAAYRLAERAHSVGWVVSLLAPPDGFDWNDVLMGKVAAT